MAKEYEVNGAATIQVGTTVTNLALEDLGISFDGVTIASEIIRIPIHTDEFGGPEGIPAAFQYLGEFAHVRADLIFWDNAVFDKIWGPKFNVAAPQATMGTTLGMGTVLDSLLIPGTARPYFRLAVLAPNYVGADKRGYDWARAFLKPSPRKIGTRPTRIQVEFYCWQQASADATVWFDRNPAA